MTRILTAVNQDLLETILHIYLRATQIMYWCERVLRVSRIQTNPGRPYGP